MFKSVTPTKTKKPKSSTFKELFQQLEGRTSLIVASIIFSIIGVFLFVFASLAFGQIIAFFFASDTGGKSEGFLISIITGGFPRDDIRSFWVAIVILVASYLVYSLSWTVQNILMIKISQKTAAKLRKDVFEKLQKMPISYFDSHSSGDLMSRMTNDIDNISQALTQSLSQFIQSILNIVISLIVMFVMSSVISIITLVLLPLMMGANVVFIKKAQPYFFKQQEKIGNLNGYIEEMISGQKMTNLLNREAFVFNDFQKLNNDLVTSAVKSQTYSGFMFPWLSFTTNILFLTISCIAVAFNIFKLPLGGLGGFDGLASANVAFLATFTLLLRNLINPITQLLSTMNVVQAGLAGAERVFEIIHLVPKEDAKDAIDLLNVEGNIEFKDVNFGYTKDKLNLKNANIVAKPGEIIAIVGPTGAGKTTIINLLTKFYEYNDGQIFIDGHEINTVKEKSWRDNISIVLQDTFLFSDTIRENIRYGNLSATDQEVEDAAKIANAHQFIMQLENQYDTVLDSNENDLSQGQRQLLAIARAVIAKSNILILDEATSSVDTRTEIQIQTAMLRLMKGRTSFVIAHRLSTIKNADQILVVDDGNIIERGTHKELLKIKDGFYSNLYHSQFKNNSFSE